MRADAVAAALAGRGDIITAHSLEVPGPSEAPEPYLTASRAPSRPNRRRRQRSPRPPSGRCRTSSRPGRPRPIEPLLRFRAWRLSSWTGPNARLSDHPGPLQDRSGACPSSGPATAAQSRVRPRREGPDREQQTSGGWQAPGPSPPHTGLRLLASGSPAASRPPRDRSGDVRLRSALRRGLQLLERALPALPDVARGERRRQLAEALETDVVLHPQGGADRSRTQAVAHVPREGLSLLVLLEHARRLRARHPHAHLLLPASAVEVVVVRARPRIVGRAHAGLKIALKPALRRADRPPDILGRPRDLDALAELRHGPPFARR